MKTQVTIRLHPGDEGYEESDRGDRWTADLERISLSRGRDLRSLPYLTDAAGLDALARERVTVYSVHGVRSHWPNTPIDRGYLIRVNRLGLRSVSFDFPAVVLKSHSGRLNFEMSATYCWLGIDTNGDVAGWDRTRRMALWYLITDGMTCPSPGPVRLVASA